MEQKKSSSWFLAAGILLLSCNMRGPITAIGVLVGEIQQDLSISSSLAGLLTSIPLFSFAVFSLLVPSLSDRIGNIRSVVLGLLILIAGLLMRSFLGTIGLFLGMFLTGLGITVFNVLIPSLIKENFPLQIGLMTGLYNCCLTIFSGISSGASVPISQATSWQFSLLIWLLPAAVSLVIWAFALRREPLPALTQAHTPGQTPWKVLFRSPLAWQVAFCMGLQSFIWYGLSAWLPSLLLIKGMNAESAGFIGSFLQLLCLPSAFLVPIIATRMHSQRLISAICYSCYFVGLLGLLFIPGGFWLYFFIAILGLGCGTGVPLAVSFIALRSNSVSQAAQLSGMSQSFGYLLATFSPILLGFLFDLTHGWTIPLLLLAAAAAAMIVFGQFAGRNLRLPE